MNLPEISPLFIRLTFVAGILLLDTPKLSAAEAPKPSLGDGSSLHFAEEGLTIVPPTGWEVLKKVKGRTLLMQMPPPKTPIKDYSKPLYTRNITVAIQHEAQPLDEAQAQEIRAKLEKDFGLAAGVSNFQIIEHRFIDSQDKRSAILFYTAFDYVGFPMSQMHIYKSGAKKAALLTYTDLAEEFQKNEAASTAAWNSMMSADLEGEAPQRYERFQGLALTTVLLLVCGALIMFLRRRQTKQFFETAERHLYEDDEEMPRRRKSALLETSEHPKTSLTREASVL